VARVSSQVPESFVTLVQQLAVAPIPERDENAVAPYVKGVVSALIDKGLLAQKAALLGRLQRADPTDREAYNVIQHELLEIETARRRVRGE
jgi:DNA primase